MGTVPAAIALSTVKSQAMSASMKTNNHECKSHPANYVIQLATTGHCVPVREGGEQLV